MNDGENLEKNYPSHSSFTPLEQGRGLQIRSRVHIMSLLGYPRLLSNFSLPVLIMRIELLSQNKPMTTYDCTYPLRSQCSVKLFSVLAVHRQAMCLPGSWPPGYIFIKSQARQKMGHKSFSCLQID